MPNTTQLFSNNAKALLASALQASANTLTLQLGGGKLFPTIASGSNKYFKITLEAAGVREILKVTATSGDVFTVLRGQESTSVSSFPAGTSVELRITAETLEEFAKLTDRLAPAETLALVPKPISTTANSILCAELDDGGSPIVLMRKNEFDWDIKGYVPLLQGTVSSSGLNGADKVVSSAIGSNISVGATGQFLIQFLSGNLRGQVRKIFISGVTDVASVFTPFSAVPQAGDSFLIVQSVYSMLSRSTGDNSLVYAIALG